MSILLPNAANIRDCLRKLFQKRRRKRLRVICVAYIGQDAPRLLDDFTDVEIYCWPQPGATNPHALEALGRKGARIHLVDRLHMKLYWVEGSGFVITSANLSASALEPGGHHEIGWFETDWRKIEMPALIRSFGRSRSLTIEELARMHRLHDEYWRAHPVVLTRTNRQKPSTYSDWHAGTQAQKWKLTWWDDPNAKLAASTRKHLKEVTGTPDYEGFMDCEEGQLKRCDWLLTFRVTGKVIKEIEWMYIDCVHKLTADERRESGYACQAVQLKRIGGQVRPPFDCKSANFQTAFREVAKKCFKPLKGEWKTLVPPTSFLNELARRIKGSSTGHFGSARRKALP